MPFHRRRVDDNGAESVGVGVVEQHKATDASSEILLGFILGLIELLLLQNAEECSTNRIVIQK